MYLWPFRLLPPLSARWYRQGATQLGPVSIDGAQQQASRTDGGGLWRLDCTFSANTRARILALRAWHEYLDAGTVEFLMPVLDLHFAPRNTVAGVPQKPGSPTPATDCFSESGSYGSPMMVASVVEDAALRATSLAISMTQGASPEAGQIFSINHASVGWRKYNIQRIADSAGDAFTLAIRPPLREAVSADDAIEFDMPRCVMRLHPESANALSLPVEMLNGGGTVSASFIESMSS